MASSSPGTTTPIQWSVQPRRIGGLTISVARLSIDLYLPRLQASLPPVLTPCWLDSAAPLSVVPLLVQKQGIAWRPVVPPTTASWFGQTCDVGHIDVWLPTQQAPFLRGPFPMLAKFARRDPPHNIPPLLLGLHFLLSLQATLHLDPPPQDGVLSVP